MRFGLRVALGAAVLAGGAVILPAQDLPEAAPADERLLFTEIPSVQGASRFEQQVTQAPSSVTLVTREEIHRFGYRTLAELLRGVRGIYVSYDRNYTYFGERGFARPGDYNTRVLVLIDGHRLNDTVYDYAPIGTEFPLDLELIDRVEIIRGPTSSLYGTSGFFGVVNILTRRGRDFAGGELVAGVGDAGTRLGRATYGQRFSGGEILVSATTYHRDGEDLSFPGLGQARGLDGDGFDQVFAKVSAGDLTLLGVWGDRDKDIPTASFGTVFGRSGTRTSDRLSFADLRYQHGFASGIKVEARLFYDDSSYHGDYVYSTDAGDDGSGVYLNHDLAWGTRLGAEMQVHKSFGAHHDVIAGCEGRANLRQDQLNYDSAVNLDDERSSGSFALFIQDEIALGERLRLSAGARYDRYQTFGGTLNPRLALVWEARPDLALKLVYGRAFRAPNAYELHYEDGFTSKPSRDLEPEVIRAWELIAERYLRRGLSVTANAFVYETAGLIELENDPADGQLVFRNRGRVRARGLEIGGEGELPGGLLGRLGFAYSHAEVTRGGALTNSPRQLGQLGLSAPLGESLTAALEVIHVGRRRTLLGSSAAAYSLANLTFTTRRSLAGWDLQLRVANLLDRRYVDPGSAEHVQDGIVQDGRTWLLQVGRRILSR